MKKPKPRLTLEQAAAMSPEELKKYKKGLKKAQNNRAREKKKSNYSQDLLRDIRWAHKVFMARRAANKATAGLLAQAAKTRSMSRDVAETKKAVASLSQQLHLFKGQLIRAHKPTSDRVKVVAMARTPVGVTPLPRRSPFAAQ